MKCQFSGIGLRLVPLHLIGIPTQLRKSAAAQLASSTRNSEIIFGGFSSRRVRAPKADLIARSHLSERRIDFSSVKTLASIFWGNYRAVKTFSLRGVLRAERFRIYAEMQIAPSIISPASPLS
jgi:hypothetical protein